MDPKSKIENTGDALRTRANSGRQGTLEELSYELEGDDKVLSRALVLAGVAHLLFLGWQLGPADATERVEPPTRAIQVVISPTPRMPEVPPEAPPPVERMSRQEPMPDPDPSDPEPVRRFEEPAPVIEIDQGDIVWKIPEAPPEVDTGPIHMTSEVTAPVKLFAPAPKYPEMARLIGVQGVVVVEAIIDTEGSVNSVRVLRAPPRGLGEAAVTAIKSWRFEPALLNGQPVAVYYNLTVNFTIQGRG